MRIGMNGTAPEELMSDVGNTLEMMGELADIMYQPNPRDWAGDEDGFREAQRAAREFCSALKSYEKFLRGVQSEVSDYMSLRAQFRR